MIRSTSNLRSTIFCAGVVAGASLTSALVRAEIPLVDPTKTDGWEVTTTGRVDAYLSWMFGETINTSGLGRLVDPTNPNATERYRLIGPQIGVQGNPTPSGAVSGMTDKDLNNMRVRGGFASTIFGLNVYKQVSPNVKLTIKLGLWAGIQNGITGGFRQQNDTSNVDWRDQFMRLDSKWGSVWGGRLVGLFNRGGMRMNWFLIHREGVGHPCSVDSNSSATCGHTGVGSLHPMRNGQLGFATPELRGLQLNVAVLDPSMIDQMWNRTLYPRLETEATFRKGVAGGNELNLWANGMYQLVGRVTEMVAQPSLGQPGIVADKTIAVFGYGGGAWGRIGVLGLGATGWTGKGLGTAWAFGNTAVDDNGTLRTHFGYLGVGNLRFGGWEIAAAYGSSNVRETAWDADAMNINKISVIKEVRGISGKVAYHLGPVVFSVDGMNVRHEWHRGEVLVANIVSGGMLAEW